MYDLKKMQIKFIEMTTTMNKMKITLAKINSQLDIAENFSEQGDNRNYSKLNIQKKERFKKREVHLWPIEQLQVA